MQGRPAFPSTFSAASRLRVLFASHLGRGGLRDFLALHYKLNTRLDNEFWRHCQADTPLGALGPLLDFYRENGPSCLTRLTLPSQDRNMFNLEGYLVMLVGNRAPYEARHQATAAEITAWNQMKNKHRTQAAQGLTVAESLRMIRSPQWRWAS